MLILALDTATSDVSAALVRDGEVLADVTTPAAAQHGELVGPALATCLAAIPEGSGLDLVVVGVGPGPFTGLRVGVVSGLMVGRVRGVPVRGVCSLDAIAADVVRRGLVDGPFGVATDARRKEVYLAAYDVTTAADAGTPLSATRREHPVVVRPQDVEPSLAALPTAGRGPQLYPETFAHGIPVLDASAVGLAACAERGGDLLTDPEPWYLRRPDAVPSASRKSVLGA